MHSAEHTRKPCPPISDSSVWPSWARWDMPVSHTDTVPRLAAKGLMSRLLQNLALNVAEKGFTISVFNRTYEKTEKAVARAKKEGKAV